MGFKLHLIHIMAHKISETNFMNVSYCMDYKAWGWFRFKWHQQVLLYQVRTVWVLNCDISNQIITVWLWCEKFTIVIYIHMLQINVLLQFWYLCCCNCVHVFIQSCAMIVTVHNAFGNSLCSNLHQLCKVS